MFEPGTPPLEDVQVAEYPVIAAPPSLAGTLKFTMIEASPAVAVPIVGALGDKGVVKQALLTARDGSTYPVNLGTPR